MPRPKFAVTLALLVACAVALSTAPAFASDPLTPRDFPSVKRVAKVFPHVNSRELDTTHEGSPASLPHCALDDVDDLASNAPDARLGFWAAYSGSKRRTVGVIAESFRFANRKQAARWMRVAKRVLSRCSGLQVGAESYSRYHQFKVPNLGDDRFGYFGGYEYDFEPGYRGVRVVVTRDGRDILVVEAGKFGRKGSKPAGSKSTVKFARLVLRKNPLS